MPRQFQRKSIFDEFDEMRDYMDFMFRHMIEPGQLALLPASDKADIVPLTRRDLKVDVTEHDDDVMVTADMIPGTSKEDITLDLINPKALEISCERKQEKTEQKGDYYLQERTFGSFQRVILLPKPVSEKGATATFRNGVLEVRMKKEITEPKTKITIE